jgi:lipoprotein-anchoring transpeptidase ErfK/SrfK
MNTFGKAIFATVLPILSAAAVAQQTKSPQNQTKNNDNLVLVVSVADKRMAVVDHGAVRKIYTVAVGKPSTPSPTGTFRVISRVANPTYYHQGKLVLPGTGNPVGSRWIGLSERGYGIHGTNAPGSIGTAASHGCIRMNRRDLEELFALLKTGEAVEIIGEPNAETASLFGTNNGTPKSNSVPADAAVAIAAATIPVTTQAPIVTTMAGQ